ncbi:sulfatase family protein [Thermopirellula anaerolimosa]
MFYRTFGAGWFLAAIACCWLPCTIRAASAAESDKPIHSDRPNVVMIISDDQAWTDYGFMGHPVIRTPNLDRLAAQSRLFTRGYVPSSLCRPSLATMITGLYPHRHGITGNDPTLPDPNVNSMTGRRQPKYARYYETLMHRIETHPTLPRLLAERGYVSFQSGKWWEGNFSRGGFTEGMTHGDPNRGGRHGDEGLKIGREGMEPVFDFVRRAKADQKPFFLWYAPFMPHAPHTPPKRILDHYLALVPSEAVARYYAMCEWFDETCGELLRFLESEGLSSNTVIVYVCDNGWIQDPDKPHHNFMPRSKRSPYEGGIRTPIMVGLPGKIEPRRDEKTLVSSIDLAPTILRLCGVSVPADLPGVDLLDDQALAARSTVFGEIYDHNVADVDHPTKSLQYRWIIHGDWKLIVPADPATPAELYNVMKDPHEEHPVTDADLERRLRGELDAWWNGEEQ